MKNEADVFGLYSRKVYTSVDFVLNLLSDFRIQTEQMHFLEICHLLCCFAALVACDRFAF